MRFTDTPEPASAAWQIKTLAQSAVALMKTGDQAGAEKIFRQILDVAPFNGAALGFFARNAYTKGDYQEALALLDKAIQGAPRNPRHFQNRAQVYWASGRFDEALGDLDHIRELLPDYAFPLFQKALVLRDMGQRDAAVRLAIETWRQYPEVESLDLSIEDMDIPGAYRSAVRETANLIRSTQLMLIDSELEPILEAHGKAALQRVFDAVSAYAGLDSSVAIPGRPLLPGLSVPGLGPELPTSVRETKWFAALEAESKNMMKMVADCLPQLVSTVFTRLPIQEVDDETYDSLLMMLGDTPLLTSTESEIELIYTPEGLHRLHLPDGNNWRLILYLPLEANAATLNLGIHSLDIIAGKAEIAEPSQNHHVLIAERNHAMFLKFSIWHPDLSHAERAGLLAAVRGIYRFAERYGTAPALNVTSRA